jgi:hypothetical protein
MENTDPAKPRPVNATVGKMIVDAAAAAGCDPAMVIEIVIAADPLDTIKKLLGEGNFPFENRKKLLDLRDEWTWADAR